MRQQGKQKLHLLPIERVIGARRRNDFNMPLCMVIRIILKRFPAKVESLTLGVVPDHVVPVEAREVPLGAQPEAVLRPLKNALQNRQ